MDDYQDVLIEEVKRLREVVAKLQEKVVTLMRENKSLYSLLSTKSRGEGGSRGRGSTQNHDAREG